MVRKAIKLVLLLVIPSILIFIAAGAYEYSQVYNLFDEESTQSISLDEYTIGKNQNWAHRFDHLSEESYNEEKRKIIGAHDHYLEIERKGEKYLIEYEYEVDREIIEGVSEIKEKEDQTQYAGIYFLVKYHKFSEVVYFDLNQPKGKGLYQSEVCLQLPIDSSENVVYHIDDSNNIWIVTLSLNKIVFIQIYSCVLNKLIKQYRYSLTDNIFISQINRIVKKDEQCMNIQVITYGLNRVGLQVCPFKDQIKEVIIQQTSQVLYQKKQIKEWRGYRPVNQDQEKSQFLKIFNYILDFFRVDQQYRFQVSPELVTNPKQNIYQYFDTISLDEKNQYLLTLSQNKSETGIIALNRYLINSKTPLFHGNSQFDEFSVLDLMKKESKGIKQPTFEHSYIDPKLNQTKKVLYKAAFKTSPNFKIEHIGLGQKSLIFWPDQKLEDTDYLAIRTRDGALIIHKTELKGVYGEMPVSFEEISQRVDEKPLEAAPKIYEIHAKQLNLISRPIIAQDKSNNIEKIELVNLLSGRPIFTHSIRHREGYRYISSFLLNNQWWILEYNPEKKKSIAKKYEFYVLSTNSEKVHSLQMTYGDLQSQDHLFGQDDLAAVMEEFVKEQNNGYMFLSIYRCVDEYYYIEYTDASASLYGVARIHFTKMSNRIKRQAHTISDQTKKKLIIDPTEVIPSKYDTTPYAVALKNTNIFKHLPEFLNEEWKNKVWYNYCKKGGSNFRKMNKLQKYYYYPQVNYAIGDYGCNYNSEEAQSDKIYSINMRNLIISARLNNHSIIDFRKKVIYALFSLFPFYCVLLLFSYLVTGKRDEPQPEKREGSEVKAEGKKNKKNKRE